MNTFPCDHRPCLLVPMTVICDHHFVFACDYFCSLFGEFRELEVPSCLHVYKYLYCVIQHDHNLSFVKTDIHQPIDMQMTAIVLQSRSVGFEWCVSVIKMYFMTLTLYDFLLLHLWNL